MEFLKLAAEYSLAFKAAGVIVTALVMLTMTLVFPVDHKDNTPLGDAGIGLAAAFVKQWGWLRALAGYGVGAIGVALFFLPSLSSI